MPPKLIYFFFVGILLSQSPDEPFRGMEILSWRMVI